MKILKALALVVLFSACASHTDWNLKPSESDLSYPTLAQSWDEAVPLGNATVGALVWQRDTALRFSLDRVDLWDLRPTDSLSGSNYSFEWVKSQIDKGDYLPVQKKFDWPYDGNPAPSKIPGAALEFPSLGEVESVHLYLNNALCEVKWKNGAVLRTFVQANQPIGWFRFENLPFEIAPEIVAPTYEKPETNVTDPVTGQDLARLGYKQGSIKREKNHIAYHQNGWGDFGYDVAVAWENGNSTCEGVWSVTSTMVHQKASDIARSAMKKGLGKDWADHMAYWDSYWAKSSICIPDKELQKQYDNEMYKFGSAARKDSYPISLQAVWTADNGKLPPWKGDYHHDLNTQLSYWPAYSANHLDEAMGYLNTLWDQSAEYRKFTRQYFGKEGLCVPGVCTLTGEPMGGWIQYSMSQTTAAWLAQHFYLQWKYSADEEFLRERAYPFVKEAAEFLEAQTEMNGTGERVLAYTSSPEIFDNSLQAWFKNMTNYDLALTSYLFKIASEMAAKLGLSEEAAHWQELKSQMPDFALDNTGALAFAKGVPYEESHRHFSHAMAFHPLGLLNWEEGGKSQDIIKNTINRMDSIGPRWWTGYSYAWLGNMKARAFDGEGARDALSTFAQCFCLPNTFHANGDQSGTGKSAYEYRPFTLEGNFAFAAGVQEMLLQSHTDTIRIFPAIPSDWKDVSFKDLRAQGAFLVSAEMKNGHTQWVEITSEKGEPLVMYSPIDGSLINRNTMPGEIIRLERPIPVPSPAQAEWQRKEQVMFVHYGPAAFQGREYDNWSSDISEMHMSKLNTDQWCEVAASWGAKMIVFVAKHCGGFCWWQTETSDYGVKNVPWKNGKGDVMKDLSESCKKYGLDLGVYVYPGDEHWGAGIGSGGRTQDPSKQEAYNEVYRKQLKELLCNYGPIKEVWFDGNCHIPVGDILEESASDAVVFQGKHATIRWVGNEDGYAPDPNWYTLSKEDMQSGGATAVHSDAFGNVYAPVEVDVPMLKNKGHKWFWAPNCDSLLLTKKQLMDLYFNSVGRGSVLLLNSTPDTTGLIPATHAARYREFGETIKEYFDAPIASTKGEGSVYELKLKKPTALNCIMLQEVVEDGQRVLSYTVEGSQDGQNWEEITEGTSIGHKKIDRFPTRELKEIRVVMNDVRAFPHMENIALYELPEEALEGLTSENAPIIIGSWGFGTYPNDRWTDLTLDLTKHINGIGQYEVRFRTTGYDYHDSRPSGIELDQPILMLYGQQMDEAMQAFPNEGKILITRSQQTLDDFPTLLHLKVRSRPCKSIGEITIKKIQY